jgi:hypothetical protein
VSQRKLDIQRDPGGVARALVDRYGVAAISVARYKALWARSVDDLGGWQAWQWVAGATAELLRAEPGYD